MAVRLPSPHEAALWAAVVTIVIAASKSIMGVEDVVTLFWLGGLVNVSLSAVKMGLARVAVHKKSLLADAVHGLGDTAAELVTALAYNEAARPPDREHPWGHGKIETVGALVVTSILLYIAGTMGWDSATALFASLSSRAKVGDDSAEMSDQASLTREMSADEGTLDSCRPGMSRPGLVRQATFAALLASMALKEALFNATLGVGESAHSKLAVATAWHHRSDSLASGVALASQLGAGLGQQYLDALGGGVVASMLAHSACHSLRESLDDLLDYNAAADDHGDAASCGRGELARSILSVQGVRNQTLRTRRMGPYCLVDVTIVVDARISASAASVIAEAVHNRVIGDFRPFVTDVLVHVDPDGSPQTHHMETHTESSEPAHTVNPEEVEARVREAVLAAPGAEAGALPPILEVTELQTYYYTDGNAKPFAGVKVDIRLPSAGTTLHAATAAARAARHRVLTALPGVVREVDVDLELDETSEELVDRPSPSQWSSFAAPPTKVRPPISGGGAGCAQGPLAGGKGHGSWAEELCQEVHSSWPLPPATPPIQSATAAARTGGRGAEEGLSDKSLQKITLVWERGPESRLGRAPERVYMAPGVRWTPGQGGPAATGWLESLRAELPASAPR